MTRNSTQTEYGGVIFRSRLEARWAFVFNHLQMKWKYEARPFAIKNGMYLPDFEIESADGVGILWVEIKPPLDILEEEEVLKMQNFSEKFPQLDLPQKIRMYIVFAGGYPDEAEIFLWADINGIRMSGPLDTVEKIGSFPDMILPFVSKKMRAAEGGVLWGFADALTYSKKHFR